MTPPLDCCMHCMHNDVMHYLHAVVGRSGWGGDRFAEHISVVSPQL